MIDEILEGYKNGLLYGNTTSRTPNTLSTHEALTAIYEIGLEVIGEDEYINVKAVKLSTIHDVANRNSLKASQRKAWAKACGVDI